MEGISVCTGFMYFQSYISVPKLQNSTQIRQGIARSFGFAYVVNFQVSGEWTLGAEVCDMWTSTDVLCCTASILHLVAIAIDRSVTGTVHYIRVLHFLIHLPILINVSVG